MAVSLDATAGGASANSYATVNEADAYFNTRLRATAWTGASSDDKARALISACEHLEVYFQWVGYPTANTQRLGMPRVGLPTRNGAGTDYSSTTIPDVIKAIQFEQALVELQEERTAEWRGGGLKRVTADVVTAEWDSSQVSLTPRVVAQHVWAMAAPWILNGEVRTNTLTTVCLERV